MKNLKIYTDGASRGNPGPGGWGSIIISQDEVVELTGSLNPATNNQMELGAVVEGLKYIKEKYGNCEVELYADSRYVLNGIEKWIDGWVRNGWTTTAKKPVENKQYWEELLGLRNFFGKNLKLTKVDGHSGHLYNDRCDELAVMSALNKKLSLFYGTKSEYEKFLKENPPKSMTKTSSSKKSSSVKAYSYVSLVDGKVYIDKDWSTCEKRVKGKNAKFRKVFSKEEETELIQNYTLSSLL